MFLRIALLVASTAMCSAVTASSTTVFRSVDENGVITFSDTMPDNATSVETVELAVTPAADAETTARQLQEMRATTDRMVADRQAREQHRAKLRREQRQEQSLAAAMRREQDATLAAQRPQPYYYPTYTPYRRHPHPPLLYPRPPVVQQPTPRFDYPASLIRRYYPQQVREAFH